MVVWAAAAPMPIPAPAPAERVWDVEATVGLKVELETAPEGVLEVVVVVVVVDDTGSGVVRHQISIPYAFTAPRSSLVVIVTRPVPGVLVVNINVSPELKGQTHISVFCQLKIPPLPWQS